MIEESDGQANSEKLVKKQDRAESSDRPRNGLYPGSGAESKLQSGEGQSQKRARQRPVQIALCQRETDIEAFISFVHRVSSLFRTRCSRPGVAAESGSKEPQNRMQYEESENAHQQQIHKQRGVVQPWIVRRVFGIRVRIVLDETRIGARMALAAGSHQVRRSHH